MKDPLHLSTFTLDELASQMSGIVKNEIPALLKEIQPPEVSELLTRKQAAKFLGVSLPTIHAWTKTGKITGYRISSRIRYKRSELENSLKQIRTRE